MNKLDKAKTYVDEAIEAVENELSLNTTQKPIISIEVLSYFLSILKEMRASIESGSIPPRDQRSKRMSHIIADSWPYEYSLSEIIIRAEHSYLEM